MQSSLDAVQRPDFTKSLNNGAGDISLLGALFALESELETTKLAMTQSAEGSFGTQNWDRLFHIYSLVGYNKGMVLAAQGDISAIACKSCGEKRASRPVVNHLLGLRTSIENLKKGIQGDKEPGEIGQAI